MTEVINHHIDCSDDDPRDKPPPVEEKFPEDIPKIITVEKSDMPTTNQNRYGECTDLSLHILNPWGLIGHSIYGLLCNAMFSTALEGGVSIEQETRCNLLKVKVMVR
jgi:hypothetical protein